MTAAAYIARRAVLVDPSPLLEALADMAEELRARATHAGGRDRSLLAREIDDIANDLARLVEVHTP